MNNTETYIKNTICDIIDREYDGLEYTLTIKSDYREGPYYIFIEFNDELDREETLVTIKNEISQFFENVVVSFINETTMNISIFDTMEV